MGLELIEHWDELEFKLWVKDSIEDQDREEKDRELTRKAILECHKFDCRKRVNKLLRKFGLDEVEARVGEEWI